MNLYSGIVIGFLINFYFFFIQDKDPLRYHSLEPYDFHLQYLRDDSAMLVDVREFFEYRSKRIKGAVNIPSSGNLEFAADTISKNRALFLYCSNDYRSIMAAEVFYDMGFRKIYSLEGGMAEWKKEGFPLDRKRKKRTR